MTDKQLTQAFEAALTEYESVPFRPAVDRTQAEFFFLQGYREGSDNLWDSYLKAKRPTWQDEEIAGHPV